VFSGYALIVEIFKREFINIFKEAVGIVGIIRIRYLGFFLISMRFRFVQELLTTRRVLVSYEWRAFDRFSEDP
jgi:hypothetical protein